MNQTWCSGSIGTNWIELGHFKTRHKHHMSENLGTMKRGELPNQILLAQISVRNQHEESESNVPNQHGRMSGMVGMVGMVVTLVRSFHPS